jgi:hypothetical protein
MGNFVEADAVVFATGFRQTVSFLDAHVSERIVNKARAFPTISQHPFARCVRAWLLWDTILRCSTHSPQNWPRIGVAQHLKGQLNLPSIPDMKREIKTHFEWLVGTRTAQPRIGLVRNPVFVPSCRRIDARHGIAHATYLECSERMATAFRPRALSWPDDRTARQARPSENRSAESRGKGAGRGTGNGVEGGRKSA